MGQAFPSGRALFWVLRRAHGVERGQGHAPQGRAKLPLDDVLLRPVPAARGGRKPMGCCARQQWHGSNGTEAMAQQQGRKPGMPGCAATALRFMPFEFALRFVH